MNRPMAIELHRNPQYRLEGPCPSCGHTVTVSIDTLYTTKTGACPACGQSVAYNAPPGTYRTDPRPTAAGTWPINNEIYCADCRHEIPACTCTPPKPVPLNYAQTRLPPWQRQSTEANRP